MYEKTEWKARKGTGLNKFTETERLSNTVILTNTPDSISEPGTPFSVENMNHIEQGIGNAHEALNTKQDKITPITAVTPPAAKKIACNEQGQITGTADMTKSDVGLGNVTNDAQVKRTEMGAPNGVATLDVDGLVDASQFPSFEGGLLVVNSDESLTGHGTPDSPLGVNEIDAAKIASGTLAAARIPALPASKITSGVLDVARIPGLDASKITTGVLSTERIPAVVTMQNIQTPLEIGVSALATGKLAFYYGADLTGMPRSQLYIGVNGKAQAAAPASNALDTIMDIFKFGILGYIKYGDSTSSFTPAPPNYEGFVLYKTTKAGAGVYSMFTVGTLFVVSSGTGCHSTSGGIPESIAVFGNVQAVAEPGVWQIVNYGLLSQLNQCGSLFIRSNIILRRSA